MRPATHRNIPTARRDGFTLVELLIVIGLIVLVIALAVPAFKAMTGGRSIDAAQNQLAAVLGTRRAEAIGLQKVRGVFFYLDPATERVNAILVQESDYRPLLADKPPVDPTTTSTRSPTATRSRCRWASASRGSTTPTSTAATAATTATSATTPARCPAGVALRRGHPVRRVRAGGQQVRRVPPRWRGRADRRQAGAADARRRRCRLRCPWTRRRSTSCSSEATGGALRP